MTVKLAEWAEGVNATVAASLFSLPPEEHLATALIAVERGYWIHADVLLTENQDGSFNCQGVSADTIRELKRRMPESGVDVHVMVPPEACVREDHTSRRMLLAAIADFLPLPIDRLSACAELLTLVQDRVSEEVELWTEYWVERDGAPRQFFTPGVLAMLIEPGSVQQPNPRAIETLEQLASQVNVGIDGGVNPRVAAEACEAGVAYMVIGRALFIPADTAETVSGPPDSQ